MKTVFGGNSGYIGYSESYRSLLAKSEGKYPKTLFKKEYGISEKIFNTLLYRDVIFCSEWHHTSKYGNKTKFYDIDNMPLFFMLIGKKQEAYRAYIDKRVNIYVKPIIYNNKKDIYDFEKTFRKGSEEIEILKSLNILPFHQTKRGNFTYKLPKYILYNKIVRKLFSNEYIPSKF